MADGKQQNMERNEPDGSKEDLVSSVSTVVSGLAALFLEENFREGQEILIPSLGIKIEKENLREPSQSKSLDNSNGDKHENGTRGVSP